MQDNKYYTPSIEEFYVGFEYESKVPNGEWIEVYYNKLDPNTEYEVSENKIRVPYLTKEDIEAEGFVEVTDRSVINLGDLDAILAKKVINGKNIVLSYSFGNKSLQLIDGAPIWRDNKKDVATFDTLFTGAIKNKSELKRILKMIGV